MTNLIRAELLKIRTTRTVYGLLAATLALVAVTVLSTLGQSETRELDIPLIDRDLLFIPWGLVVVFVLVLGLRSYTDEFRHASIVATLLATPDRERVLVAKLAAVTVWSLLFTAAAYALTFAIVLPSLASAGMSTSISSQAAATLLGKAALTGVLWAVLGLGIGLAVRHQVAAIAGTFVVLIIAERLVDALWHEVAAYLPMAVTDSLNTHARPHDVVPLGPLAAGLLLAGYAAAAVIAGAVLMRRRDVA